MGYCIECGAQYQEGAKFCSSCGKPIAQAPSSPPLTHSETPTTPRAETVVAVGTRKKLTKLEKIFIVTCVGLLAVVLIEQALPGNFVTPNAFNSVAFLFAICGYVYAKRRTWRFPWLYAIAGLIFVILSASVISVVAQYLHRQAESARSQKLLSALAQFDPHAAQQLSARGVTESQVKTILQPVLVRAIVRAPAQTLIAFNETRLKFVSLEADSSGTRCANAAMGTGSSSSYTVTEKDRLFEAMVYLFESAVPYAEVIPAIDFKRAQSLLADADRQGLFNDPEKMKLLPAKELCTKYMKLMHSIHSLPQQDEALVLRYMMSPK